MGESELKAPVILCWKFAGFSGVISQIPEFRNGADLTFLTRKATYLLPWLVWLDLKCSQHWFINGLYWSKSAVNCWDNETRDSSNAAVTKTTLLGPRHYWSPTKLGTSEQRGGKKDSTDRQALDQMSWSSLQGVCWWKCHFPYYNKMIPF